MWWFSHLLADVVAELGAELSAQLNSFSESGDVGGIGEVAPVDDGLHLGVRGGEADLAAGLGAGRDALETAASGERSEPC